MTFVIVRTHNDRHKTIGRLWASDEQSALRLAPDLLSLTSTDSIRIQRAEMSEIPLKFADASQANY